MDKVLQKRLVGTAVIVALAVIFVPMLLSGPEKPKEVSMDIDIPAKPSYDIPNRLPPVEPAASVAVVPPVEGQVPAVDTGTATASPEPVVSMAPQVKSPPPPAGATPDTDEESRLVEKSVTTPIQTPAPVVAQKPVVKPAAPAPAPRDVTESAGSGFVIQVGSFSSQKNADELKNRLSSAGYAAFVDATTLNSKSVYRVKVGPRPTKKLANQLRLELIDEEKLEGIIVSYP